MGLYAALIAMGQQAAKNPSLSFGGQSDHDFMNKYDPIGGWITGWGGDPLNFYGNKDNPNALLFPSSPHDPTMDMPPGGMVSGMQGISQPQNLAMMSAYQTFLKNLGAPPMAAPKPTPNAGGNAPGFRIGGRDSPGVGGGGYRGPMPGGTGLNYGGLSNLSQFGNSSTMPQSPVTWGT